MKRLRAFLCVVAVIMFGFAFTGLIQAENSYAESVVSESTYETLWSNDLPGFVGSGAGFDRSSNSVSSVGPGCRFGYDTVFENVSVRAKINFSATGAGNVHVFLRLQGDIANAVYQTTGYGFRIYPGGLHEVLKNGAVIASSLWTPPYETGVDYEISLTTINRSDGSVRVIVVSRGYTLYDSIDSVDPILGAGKFAMTSDGQTFSVSGEGFPEAVNLYDVADPVTNANFPGTTINADKSVSLTSSGAASGAAWAYQQTDFGTYKFKFTPSTASGKLRMSMGNVVGAHGMNRDDVIDANWGWAKIGYLFQWWGDNGQRHLFRNGVQIGYIWDMPAFTADKTYDMEFGVKTFTDGVTVFNRVHVKVDNVLYTFYDIQSETNIPLTLEKSGMPGALLKYTLIQGTGVDGLIQESASNATVETKTLLTSDLGAPVTNSGATFDRNGGVSSIPAGRIAGYNGNFKNVTIKFKSKFTAVGSFVLQLRGQTTVYDTPWGGSWSNKGYVVYLFSNGQTILYKNGVCLCEGWSLSSYGFGTSQEHEFAITTVNLSSTAVRVFVTIDGNVVINYVDVENALTDGGWFTIFNNTGCEGSLLPCVEYPVLSTDVDAGEVLMVGKENTLSYSLSNASNEDVVTYHVDQEKSTATANIVGDKLVPVSAGKLVVYAYVNGIYSSDVELDVFDRPVFITLPEKVVFGESGCFAVAGFTDDTILETKTFTLENVTGEATINAETGEITPIKAGTVKVYATLNGINSEEKTLTIVPKFTIDAPVSIIKGQEATLSYEANCPMPNEQITYAWEIVDGDNLISIDDGTNKLTTHGVGVATIKLVVIGESFQTESQPFTVTIVAPVMTDLPENNTILAGNTYTVDAKFNDNSIATNKVFKIENISGEATIDQTTGEITPVKAGTVKIFATVDGMDTEKVTITILPVVTVSAPVSVIKGNDATLEYGINCELPNEQITYTWEIVSGSDIANISQDGLLVVTGEGQITIKVCVIGETFQTESAIVTINAIVPILTNLPTAPIIVGGEVFSVDAKFSDNSVPTTKVFGVTNISGQASINAETGEIIAEKAGTVRIYAVLDGAKTEEYLITIIPKVFINKTGSFAFNGVYDLNNFYGANCELPNEEIIVSFEVVSGSEYVTFNPETGVLVAGANPGVVGLKVYVVGETFQAVSPVTNISIEKPIVIVQNSFLSDMYVGQTITLNPAISQGGIEIVSAEVVAISGGECVTINGTTITAIKAGTLKFKIVVNGTLVDDDEGLEIAIEDLIPTIIANDEMSTGKTQQSEVILNSDTYVPTSVVWSVIEGQEFLTISNTGLITAIKEGTAKIQVVIDNKYTSTIQIAVRGKVIISGIAQNAEMLVGGAFNISYTLNGMEISENPTIEYIVVEGQNLVNISDTGRVTALAVGKVGIKAIIDGVESQLLSFNIVNRYVNNVPEPDETPDNNTEGDNTQEGNTEEAKGGCGSNFASDLWILGVSSIMLSGLFIVVKCLKSRRGGSEK